MAGSMDPHLRMEYPDELAALLRERFGPRKNRPQLPRYQAAVSLTHAMAGLLAEEDFTVFLQTALRADRESRQRATPWPSPPRSFADWLSDELRRTLGPLEAEEDRVEAWHIMKALHDILDPDPPAPYLRCAYDAWVNTLDLGRRIMVAR